MPSLLAFKMCYLLHNGDASDADTVFACHAHHVNASFIFAEVEGDALGTDGSVIHHLAEGVEDANVAKVFAANGDEIPYWIWIDREALAIDIFPNGISALVRFKVAILLQKRDHLLYRERIHGRIAFDGDAAVGHDKDDCRTSRDAISVEDVSTSAFSSYGGIFHIEFIDPLLADLVVVDVGNFHEEYIMLIAAHFGVSASDIRLYLTAAATGVKEEINEYCLTSVEDVEQVNFVAVDVGSREVNGFVERRGLRV